MLFQEELLRLVLAGLCLINFQCMIKDKLRGLFQNEGFLRYLKNTSWLVGEKVLRIFTGIFVGVLVARYLGPDRYGTFNYAISFVGVFISLATLGLDSIVVRELVKLESTENEILGTAFTLRFFGSFFVIAILFVCVFLTNNTQLEQLLIMIIGSSTVFHCFNTIDFYFQSKVLSKYIVFSSSVALIVSSVLKLFLIYYEASLVYFSVVVIIESATLAIFLFYFFHKSGKKIRKWRFNSAIAKSLLKDSWPLILSGILVSIYLKIDQIMIKHLINDYSVGVYAAAARLSETWYFVPIVITNSLFPAIINSKSKNDGSYQVRMQQLFDFMVLISLVIAIPIVFLDDFIIELLYGVEFQSAASILVIQIWTGIFISLSIASSSWMISENLQKLYLLVSIIGILINIILNLIFIPTHGILGAAFTTMISQIISTLVIEAFFSKTRGILIMKWKSIFLVNAFDFIFNRK